MSSFFFFDERSCDFELWQLMANMTNLAKTFFLTAKRHEINL